ncbi:MAG: hypothetical protein K8S55_00355 [Phycisphaerae bacterium]|nr:hypothetical protein [Phycisphaerae bacterium]
MKRTHSRQLGFAGPLRFVFLLPVIAVFVFTGCTKESVRQYTSFAPSSRGGSLQPKHMVIGGDAKDSAAMASADEALTEADWRILEGVAPRSMWEQILQAKADADAVAAATPTAPVAPQTEPAAHPRHDVPVIPLGNGMVQIVYKLRHYGGVGISSKRDGGTQRRKITLAKPDLKPLAGLVQKQLAGKGSVAPLPSENSLVVLCPKSAKDAVLNVLNEIDKPQPQVSISARVFEVSHDFDFQYGANALIKHLGATNKQGFATKFSPKSFAGAVVNPIENLVPDPGAALRLIQIFEEAGITLDLTFQALAETGLIKVVSEPRMTVSHGETGYMLAGQELPIQSARLSNNNLIAQKVSYKPVGIQLYITPRVINDDSVKLHVVTAVTAVSGFAPLPKLSDHEKPTAIVNPILDSREAETSVTVQDGKTLVIGGMRMIRTIRRESKVPGLGDLKVIEWMFKKHRTQKQLTDLYFFVTPRIIDIEKESAAVNSKKATVALK